MLPERCSVTVALLEARPGSVHFMKGNGSLVPVSARDAEPEPAQVKRNLKNQGSEREACANWALPEFTYQCAPWARRDCPGSPHAWLLDSPPPHLQGL